MSAYDDGYHAGYEDGLNGETNRSETIGALTSPSQYEQDYWEGYTEGYADGRSGE